MEEVVEQNAE